MNSGKEARRKDAEDRRQARIAMSDQDKLDSLDKNLGPGVGAKKERAKLSARIAGTVKVAKPAKTVEAPVAVEGVKLLVEGDVGLELRAGQLTLIVGDKKPIPVISLSQLRRLADQNEFDATPFIKAYRSQEK